MLFYLVKPIYSTTFAQFYEIPHTMLKDKNKTQRLIYLGVLFSLLLNYPILSAFNKKVLVINIPLLYIGIFLFWMLLIGLLAISKTD